MLLAVHGELFHMSIARANAARTRKDEQSDNQADCQWLFSCVISDGAISKFEAHGADFHKVHLSVVEFLHTDKMEGVRKMTLGLTNDHAIPFLRTLLARSPEACRRRSRRTPTFGRAVLLQLVASSGPELRPLRLSPSVSVTSSLFAGGGLSPRHSMPARMAKAWSPSAFSTCTEHTASHSQRAREHDTLSASRQLCKSPGLAAEVRRLPLHR